MHRIILAVTLTCLAVPTIGQAQALSNAERAAIRSDVTQSADSLFDAFRRLDADAYFSFHGSDLVWAENAVLTTNQDSLFSAWKGLFASIQEVTSVDWGEVHVRVLGPDAAVFTGTFDWAGVDLSGVHVGNPGVWTAVWLRTNEGWKIVYGHESYPTAESM